MLLAVEGGGFFSSSASGYSKGLTLLLLGQKNEEKSMRVSPWNNNNINNNNQYQFVDQEADLQLASKKNRHPLGFCFGRSLASPSPLKVGPTQQQENILSEENISDKGEEITERDNSTDESDFGKSVLKSNLKKHRRILSESIKVINNHESLCEKESSVCENTGRRSVQWTDTSGGELVEIREFEPSDIGGSDDDFDDENKRKCSCRIM